MSWSYSKDPTLSDLDAVRFEIGDTDITHPLLDDEEIEYALNVEPNIYSAAARCCEAISAKFARDADYRLGPQAVQASQRAKAYADKAVELRRKGSMGKPYAGGIQKGEEALDKYLRQPAFKRGLMDFEGRG